MKKITFNKVKAPNVVTQADIKKVFAKTFKKKLSQNDIQKLTTIDKLSYYANLTETISANNGNSKTGMACLTVSMPLATCRADAPCREGCYAAKGKQACPNVCGAYWRNFRLWKEDPVMFEQQLDANITLKGLPLVRYNDAGEFPDKDYVLMIFRVATRHPTTKFLAYTKKYEMINEILDEGYTIPQNFCLRFSYWDKNWKVPNPHNLPVAFVDFKDKTTNVEMPRNTFVCPVRKDADIPMTCSRCQMCFNSKVHCVAFHQH